MTGLVQPLALLLFTAIYDFALEALKALARDLLPAELGRS